MRELESCYAHSSSARGAPAPLCSTAALFGRILLLPPLAHFAVEHRSGRRRMATALRPDQRAILLANSLVAGQYENVVDRQSAYEMLKAKADELAQIQAQQEAQLAEQKAAEEAEKEEARAARAGGDSAMSAFAKSAARAIGSNVGRQIVRGVLGSLLGGSSSRKKSSWW